VFEKIIFTIIIVLCLCVLSANNPNNGFAKTVHWLFVYLFLIRLDSCLCFLFMFVFVQIRKNKNNKIKNKINFDFFKQQNKQIKQKQTINLKRNQILPLESLSMERKMPI